jgi:SAM-dependent methyltransferase
MGNPDFGKTSGDYARHRAGFPPELFDELGGLGVHLDGRRVLDLGTGVGTLARGFALRGAEVVGLDPAAELLAEARRLDAEAGVSVEHVTARAEATGLPGASFDIVAAGQCWWWFDADAATAEARRVLKPGGRLLICSFDWIPTLGNVVDVAERLIEKHNPAWDRAGGNGVHPEFIAALQAGGFEDVRHLTFPLDVPYTHEGWRGRIRASAGVAASLSPGEVDAFDAELEATLAARFPEDPLTIPHRVYAAAGSAP